MFSYRAMEKISSIFFGLRQMRSPSLFNCGIDIRTARFADISFAVHKIADNVNDENMPGHTGIP